MNRDIVENFRGVANQFIITSEGGVMFQSYRSKIAMVDWTNKKIMIYPHYNYSVTTSKYRNMFFEERGMADLASTTGIEEHIEIGSWQDFEIIKVGD